MRCFVTGGAGFIGSHLVDALLERGHDVTVYDNLSLGKREFLAGALARGARLVQADLLDLERLCAELTGHQRVWHLAASSDIREGTRSTRLDLEQGTLATYNVLEAMRRCGVGEVAFSSSSVVYGEPARMPTPEDYGPLCPISLYGAAKLAAEGLVTAFGHSHHMRAWIFRFANIIGPRSTHGILHDFAAKLRRDPDELEVLGDGQQRKSYLTVQDCVAAMLHVVEHTKEPVNIYNLSSGDNVPVARIAELVVERWTGGHARLRYTGGRRGWTGDVPVMLLDPGKLAAAGWRAARTSEQAVAYAVDALDPKSDPGRASQDPESDPGRSSRGRSSRDPASDPGRASDAPDPASNPGRPLDALDLTSDPGRSSDAPDPASNPGRPADPPDPRSDPGRPADPPDPASDPGRPSDALDPASDPGRSP